MVGDSSSVRTLAQRRAELKCRMAIGSIAIRYFRKFAGTGSLATHLIFQEEPVNQLPRAVEPTFARFDPATFAPAAAGIATRRRVGGRLALARADVDAIDAD